MFNTAPNANVPASPALVHEFDSDDDVVTHYKAASTTRTSGRKVRFDMKKVDQVEYIKEDYVPCHGRSPRYKPHGKIGKSTHDLKQDDQLAYSNRLAIVRAKAMAFILSRTDEHINIDEVHIVIGPKIDIKVRMGFDEYGDVDEQVFKEEYIPHIPGKFGLKGNVMCTTVPVEERDKKFIMDSGSGHDLIAQKKVDRMDMEMYEDEMINFHTANGVTSTSKMTDIQFNAFKEPVKAHVLEDTPSVLSMGKRCPEQGYTFIWPSGKDLFMIDNNGLMINMRVKDHIPYVNLDQVKEPGNVKKIRSLLDILNDDCSTSDGENTLIIDGESGDEMIENEKKQSSMARNKKRRKPRSRRMKVDQYDVAVGDYVGDSEIHEMEDNDDEEDGVRSPYEPSLAEEIQDLEHDVEIDDEVANGEDDDDVIDVDEEDGEPRLSKRGALKHEARTKDHLLTHRFKNPYCESCVRAKMKHRKTFRGAFQRKLTKFGDLVTFDYVDNRQIYEHDYGVEKTIFVIRDRYTGMIQAYPSAKKDQEAVIRAVKQFMGRRKIREAYSDMAPQFIESMKALKIPMDHSLAGTTKHNSLSERNNQFLLVATTTCLLEAGIPPCFWRYAIRCVSHLLNVAPNDQEVSSWCKLHGEEFKGLLIPFGALVYFKPSGARNVEQKHKFDPMGIPGVFAGYDLAPGLHWSRKYRVWALSDWAKQNLSYDTSSPIPKLKTPHYTERVELKEPLEFPCKANYERINVTIYGLKEKERLDGSPDYIPLPEPEDRDDGDDGGDDQGGDGDDGPDGGGGRVVDSSILGEIEKMEREGAEDVARRAELPPPPGLEAGQGEPVKKDRVYVEVLGHYTEGKSGDGKIYLNDEDRQRWTKLSCR